MDSLMLLCFDGKSGCIIISNNLNNICYRPVFNVTNKYFSESENF